MNKQFIVLFLCNIFCCVGHEKIVEYLIKYGADVNAVYGVNSVDRHTLLHTANFSMICTLHSVFEMFFYSRLCITPRN